MPAPQPTLDPQQQERFDAFRRKAERLVRVADRVGGPHSRMARIASHAAEKVFVHRNPEFVKALSRMKRLPVTIDEFIESDDFLTGAGFDIWPALKEDLRDMNPDVLLGEDPIHETYLGGATGTGKTFVGQATLMYQLYLMTCFDKPQRLFGLSEITPILFMTQSTSQTITKRVIYQPIRNTILAMRYFQRYVPYNKQVDSELQLDQNLRVVPALATVQSILGSAVAGGILDEVNFMTIIERSTRVTGPNGMGGKFDQAEEIYSNISRRRKRSFTTRGLSIGCLCVSSSTRYKDDFLDRRIDQAIALEEPNVVIRRHTQFEVNPKYADGHTFGTFQIAVGNSEQGTVVIEPGMRPGVHYSANARIMDVPLPYKVDFQKNPDAALRDVVGIATDSITPFIRKRQKINDAIQRGLRRELPKLVEKDLVNLGEDGMPTLIPANMPKTAALKGKPRWIHVDLSRVADRCGITMIRLEGFTNVPLRANTAMKAALTGTDQEADTYDDEDITDPDIPDYEGVPMIETMPLFTVELAVGIQPSAVSEIDVAQVRAWIMQLVATYGLNIRAVTFDGFDSRETIQAFRKAGIHSELISVDNITAPYEHVRDALYEDRLDFQPDLELLSSELRTVEYYATSKKIDHPPRGTKDVSDALAGAVFTAMKSRRVRNGVMILSEQETPVSSVRNEPERVSDGTPITPKTVAARLRASEQAEQDDQPSEQQFKRLRVKDKMDRIRKKTTTRR